MSVWPNRAEAEEESLKFCLRFSVAFAVLLAATPSFAQLRVGTEIHWAPDAQTGVSFVDTVIATGPDFVLTATPDPTGQWETSYDVEFSGLDAVICERYVPLHSRDEREQLASMWPLRFGDTFSRDLLGDGANYKITVVGQDQLQIAGAVEDVFVLALQSETEDHRVYVSERLRTNVRVDWRDVPGAEASVPVTDTIAKIVATEVETISPQNGYEILADLDYDVLHNCAALLPER